MNKIIFAVIIILAVLLGPFITIWALNTLFPALAIPYALDTWAAIIIIHGSVRGLIKKD